eukprot:TRINITY_DN347_c0_g3_i1.p1 TRINITY_DN347_c0_g3~~TRINITY_DN347_c0_g3_i1.p1  ORF type:complete len:291 (-),score=78.61 TRINITY_DN347_c0_g3_i1:36-908(-)
MMIGTSLINRLEMEIYSEGTFVFDDHWKINMDNKRKAFKKFCDSNKNNLESVVVFGDISDIIIFQREEDIRLKFLEMKNKTNKKIFFGTDGKLWPIGDEVIWNCGIEEVGYNVTKEKYDRYHQGKKDFEYKYLNAGFSIGDVDQMCQFWTKVVEYNDVKNLSGKCSDEQGLVTLAFFEELEKVDLDLNFDLVLNVNNVEPQFLKLNNNSNTEVGLSMDYRSHKEIPIMHAAGQSKQTFLKQVHEFFKKRREILESVYTKTFVLDGKVVNFGEICDEKLKQYYEWIQPQFS